MNKPKLLYLAPFCNTPPTDGGSQRGINLLDQLTREYQVTLLTYYDPNNAQTLQTWTIHRGITVHWFHKKPTYHRQGSFFERLLASRPPGFATHDPLGLINDIDRVWTEQGPFDILYFATQLMGQVLLKTHWPAKQVLDLYDVYTPIARAKIKQVPPWRPYHWLFRLEALRVRLLETRLFKLFDLVVTISEEDAKIVSKLNAATPITIIPNGVSLPPEIARTSTNVKSILMVANFYYPPNEEGVCWFYEQVWPTVRYIHPKVNLCLVGSHSQTLEKLTKDDEQVEWAGTAPDLAPYYQQAVCVIVPILSGSGTRLKLLEAMAWGIPTVSTSLGAQGIEHANTVILADSPEDFARAIVRCILSPEIFDPSTLKAREIIVQRFSWDTIGQKLLSSLSKLIYPEEADGLL